LLVALVGCGGSSQGGDGGTDLVPHGVGFVTRTVVDGSRGTPANGDAAASPMRVLVTEIWYPARAPDGGATDGAVRGAPPDPDGAPHPLVLFVHGSSGGRRQSTFLTEALAAAGYVVAAADFPLTAATTLGGASDLHVDDQVGDLSFLADQMRAFAADPSDLLAGAVDASGYAVVGHSTGGTVALLAAEAPDVHDARVRAAVALAPCACFFGDAFFRTRALPLLIMAGTDDLFVPIATNGARAYQLAGPPKLLVTLVGGDHLQFTDYAIPDAALHPTPTTTEDDIAVALARYGGGTNCSPPPPPGTDPAMTIDEQHARTISFTAAFLDGAMRGSPAALAKLEATPDSKTKIEKE